MNTLFLAMLELYICIPFFKNIPGIFLLAVPVRLFLSVYLFHSLYYSRTFFPLHARFHSQCLYWYLFYIKTLLLAVQLLRGTIVNRTHGIHKNLYI